jgi:SAM-dependent methyltransferase
MDRLLDATRLAEQHHFWFRGFRRFTAAMLEQVAADLPARAAILDCGCGTGGNLAWLARYGVPFGFDLNGVGIRYARQYGEPRTAQASITHIPFGDARFDLVTAFDVLYSLDDEQESQAVSEMFRVLRPGGYGLFNVAALSVLRGNHSVFGHEVRRSTRRRLRGILRHAGFTIERISYTNFSLFPLMLAVRTAQRVIGLASPEEADTDIAVPAAPLNAALTAALAVEARLLRTWNMPIGSSLLCLTKKPS